MRSIVPILKCSAGRGGTCCTASGVPVLRSVGATVARIVSGTISYSLLESAIRPDIQPKSSRSHEAEPSAIWMTEDGLQPGSDCTFQQGVTKLSPLFHVKIKEQIHIIIFLITLEVRTRLLNSRGQITGQVVIQVKSDMTDHCTSYFWLWRTICLVPVPCISSTCIGPCAGRIPYAGTWLPQTNITAHTILFT